MKPQRSVTVQNLNLCARGFIIDFDHMHLEAPIPALVAVFDKDGDAVRLWVWVCRDTHYVTTPRETPLFTTNDHTQGLKRVYNYPLPQA